LPLLLRCCVRVRCSAARVPRARRRSRHPRERDRLVPPDVIAIGSCLVASPYSDSRTGPPQRAAASHGDRWKEQWSVDWRAGWQPVGAKAERQQACTGSRTMSLPFADGRDAPPAGEPLRPLQRSVTRNAAWRLRFVDSTSSTIVVGSECSSCLFLPGRCVENSYIIRPLDVRQTPWVGGPGGRLSDTPVPDPPSGFTDTPKPTPPATLSALPSLLRASSTIADSRRLSALRHCPEVGRGQSARWVRSASGHTQHEARHRHMRMQSNASWL